MAAREERISEKAVRCFGGITLRFRIAVDVDGVLADQVPPILVKLNPKYGIKLTKKDITDWKYPIMDTSIDVEIENALLDKSYVLEMPIIEGAKDGMLYLWRNHLVIIATSRPSETEDSTLNWVSLNFKFHEFCNTRGKSKRSLNADILIDDNVQNIEDFSKSTGLGLLFSQPWNQDRSSVERLIEKGKVYCCEGWMDVLEIVKMLESNK